MVQLLAVHFTLLTIFANAVDRTPLRYVPFRCRGDGISLSISFRCDGFAHCRDGSDEQGCQGPTLVEPPPSAITVSEDQWMNLTCRGTGTPAPKVFWKMNGNELLDPVCDWVSELDGTGRLACQMRRIDAGNYSCHLKSPLGTLDVQPVTMATVVASGRCAKSGEFAPRDSTQCLRCFCSGVSDLCQVADLYRWNYTMALNDWKMRFATWNGSGQVEKVEDWSSFPTTRPLYYDLPHRFIEYQAQSYGGYVQYELDPPDLQTIAQEMVLMGYNRTLVYTGGSNDTTEGLVRIQLIERNFRHLNGSAIDRTTLMTVLAYIDRFLIRMTLTGGRYVANSGLLVMDSASSLSRGLGKTTFVEECRCPTGFWGPSCERCDVGYDRTFSLGPTMGVCMPWKWHRERYVPPSTTPRRYHYV